VALPALPDLAALLHEGVRKGGKGQEEKGGGDRQDVAMVHVVSRFFLLGSSSNDGIFNPFYRRENTAAVTKQGSAVPAIRRGELSNSG
jgi:hypothetical protein